MQRLAIILALLTLPAAILLAQSPQTRQRFYSAPGAAPTLVTPAPAAPAAQPSSPPPVVHRQSRQHPTRDFDWRESFEPDFTLALDARSRLLRDGWVVNDRPVGVIQAEMAESGGYIGLFTAYDFNTRRDDHWSFAEYRPYLGYAARCLNSDWMGQVTVDAGWNYVFYPAHASDAAGEVHCEARWDELWVSDQWRVTAVAGYIRNYDKHHDTIRLGAAHQWSLLRGGQLGWTNRLDAYWGDGGKARSLSGGRCSNLFYGLGLTSQLRWSFANGWWLSPYAGLLAYPDHRAQRAARRSPLGHGLAWHCGIALEWSFKP